MDFQKIGSYLFSIPFIIFGMMHFMMGGQMAGMVPSFIPGGVFWVYLTGLALVLAGVSIIIQKKAKLASLLLAVMLGMFMVFVHIPGLMNEATMQMAMPSLLKDMALAGAALTYSALATD